MKFIKHIVLLAALLSPSLSQAVEITPAPEPAMDIKPDALGQSGLKLVSPFWEKSMWEDGLAEVSTYALNQARYGTKYPGTATLIAVRETMDPTRAVKSRDGSGVPVIKAMLQRHFVTGTYPYHQSATALIGREQGVIQRYLMSSMEWCGNAGKSWVNHGDSSPMTVMSYFDGYGDVQQDIALGSDGVLADTLWIWTRAWVAAGQPELPAFSVVDSQIEAKTVSTKARPATITAEAGKHGGSLFSSATPVAHVTVTRGTNGAQVDRFIIGTKAPYTLFKWIDSQGSEWTLKKSQRFAYWER